MFLDYGLQACNWQI